MIKGLNFRKIVSIFLSASFLIVFSINAITQTFAQESGSKTAFYDLNPNSTYFSAIEYLTGQKVLQGYPDGTFRPEQKITRAELLKVLIAGQGIAPNEDLNVDCFQDVAKEWFAKYICYGFQKNWISGYEDNSFKPFKTINKVEALKMLINTTRIETRNRQAGEEWYQPYEDKAAELMLLADIGWRADHEMTRGEIADAIVRTIVARKYGQRYTASLFEKFKQEVKSLADLPLFGKKILMVVAPSNFNDEEYFTARTVLKSAGFTLETASTITGTLTSSMGKKINNKNKLSDIAAESYSAVVFVGGPGTIAFQNNADYYNLALDAASYNLIIGAICLAPKILAPSKIFEGITVTGWDDEKAESKKMIEENGGIFSGKEIEVDGKIITANGPNQSKVFAEKIIEILKDEIAEN